MKRNLSIFLALLALYQIKAQDNNQLKKMTNLPIIDVHVHAGRVNPESLDPPLCPWFLSNMPGFDPNEKVNPRTAHLNYDCVDPLMPATSDEEMKNEIVKRIKDMNLTMVVFGDPAVIRSWMKEVPEGRIIPGIGIGRLTVEQFRDSLKSGFYKYMSEIAPQYQGMSPSDMSMDPYFAVAEELNIPAGIHMGTGGNGMSNIASAGRSKFRASLGDPFLLEEILIRHPKLKICVQHAGYPLIDNMIALMGAHAYVYVDISGMIWSYPLDDIHRYIKRLVQAGFGKRIMYGTDFMIWPRLVETSMGVIEHAQYLSKEQKRDILFNNAARFFRMDSSQFEWPDR